MLIHMAKGSKLTASRSDRYLESYGYSYCGDESEVTEEFSEEDVWSAIGGVADVIRGGVEDFSNDWGTCGTGASNHVWGLSIAFEDSSTLLSASPRITHQFRGSYGAAAASPGGWQRHRHVASSAPVSVPDWSKIYRTDSVESMHDSDEERVPPHEYLAREFARSRKMMAPSVFEGQGRTLKGRDMSRVRDAVWSQTGFDG